MGDASKPRARAEAEAKEPEERGAKAEGRTEKRGGRERPNRGWICRNVLRFRGMVRGIVKLGGTVFRGKAVQVKPLVFSGRVALLSDGEAAAELEEVELKEVELTVNFAAAGDHDDDAVEDAEIVAEGAKVEEAKDADSIDSEQAEDIDVDAEVETKSRMDGSEEADDVDSDAVNGRSCTSCP